MADLLLAIATKRQRVPTNSIERPDKWLIPLEENSKQSLYFTSVNDDEVQTQIARKEGPWDLEKLYPSFPLVTEFLSRFTIDELRSRSVDIRFLPPVADNDNG